MPERRAALQAHHHAVHRFLDRARAVSPAEWHRPRAEGKWSPGQVAEHLALSYESGCDVLRGTAGPGAPGLVRPILRTLLLRPVLWLGRFPPGSKSPPALRPGTSTAAGAGVLDRLQAAAAAFERDAVAVRDTTVDHPAFGRVPLADFVRLQEIHTRHHCGQLPSRAS